MNQANQGVSTTNSASPNPFKKRTRTLYTTITVASKRADKAILKASERTPLKVLPYIALRKYCKKSRLKR